MDNKFFKLEFKLVGFLTSASLVACLATILSFAGRLWWRFDLTTHFRLQYFIFLLAASVVFLITGKKMETLVFACFSFVNLIFIAPLYLGGPANNQAENTHRAMLINVNASNREHGTVLDLINKQDPDIIVINEVNNRWMNELSGLAKDYPHFKIHPRGGCFGIALFSKILATNSDVVITGDPGLPTVIATLDVDGRRLKIIGVHTLPPKFRASSRHRNHQLKELAGMASLEKGPVMLLGDLNTTSWSPYFKDLVNESGLKDSRKGFGLQNTWPSFLPYFGIAIDHILHSEGIKIVNHEIGPNIGSDHFPVIVDFYVESDQ